MKQARKDILRRTAELFMGHMETSFNGYLMPCWQLGIRCLEMLSETWMNRELPVEGTACISSEEQSLIAQEAIDDILRMFNI